MRKIFAAIAALCLSLPALATARGYTSVMATSITDATGNALASGTATFQVVDAAGHPLPVKLTGGGQIITEPVSVAVTNGTFTAQVVDVSLTQPSFPCVSLTIVDNSTGSTVWSNSCLQPTGASYSLDAFSTNTSPILPQAGDTVQGNLGVNGDMNITGNLSVGAFTPDLITANVTNGVLNASLYGGADILAQAQTAFAACSNDCTVFIPAGSYTASTTLTLPNTQNRFALVMDPAAVIHYTGTGDAIEGPTIPGGTNHDDQIIGGWITGTVSGQNGIRLNPVNHIVVRDVKVSGFTSTASQLVGNGILDAGANSVEIEDVSLFGNKTGLAGTEVNGYSSIGVHVIDSDLSNNNAWGIVTFDNHVSATQENTWVIENNILEGNGTGGIDLAHSNDTTIRGNHFEQAGIPIRLNNNYNGDNNKVLGNYFISSSDRSFQVQVVNGFRTVIDGNYEVPAGTVAPCFVSVVNATDIDMQHNSIASTAERCYPGTTPGWISQFEHTSYASIIKRPTGGAVSFPTGITTPSIITSASTPTVAFNSVGVGGTITPTFKAGSTATTGLVTFTTGASPFGGQVLILTFTIPNAAPNGLTLLITPGNAAATGVTWMQGASSTTDVQLDVASGLAANTTYTLSYQITGY